jgi:hypothetical protein
LLLQEVPAAWIFCAAVFSHTAAAQFLVPQDQLRMLLFFPAVGLFFLVLGGAGGWISVLASLVIFATTLATGAVNVSPMAVSTFAITLCVTSVFFYVLRTQAIRALDTIEKQNDALNVAACLICAPSRRQWRPVSLAAGVMTLSPSRLPMSTISSQSTTSMDTLAAISP